MTIEQVSYLLRHAVFGILKTLVVRASQNNLDLTYDVDPDIPDQLIGDSLRRRQVITNLVGNAIKFTPSKVTRKGHVALSCRLLSIESSTVKLEFCVTDTGIGIAKDNLVSLMSGNMWVESELSKGSKFFTIASQISHSSIESVLSKMQPFAKRTILFVDTLGDRTGVADRVKELGLRPYVAKDVSQVADKECCSHIDTILVYSLTVVRVRYLSSFTAPRLVLSSHYHPADSALDHWCFYCVWHIGMEHQTG